MYVTMVPLNTDSMPWVGLATDSTEVKEPVSVFNVRLLATSIGSCVLNGVAPDTGGSTLRM